MAGLLAIGLAASNTSVHAQSLAWESVEQQATWYAAFVDHAVTSRTALSFDGQWRRMGLANEPQQLLLRPGVQFTVTPGIRLGSGYAFIATAPYGEAPSATPLREHRAWQQLVLAHRAGPLSFSHRYRWEQRWLAPVVNGETDEFRYQQRARYMVRGQGNLTALTLGKSPILAFVWNELLLPVGHGDATLRVTQNRAGAGVGLPVGSRQRVEVGYMNLWNALPAARVNEFNHTLTLSYYWTFAR
jgi:hypothetical protein